VVGWRNGNLKKAAVLVGLVLGVGAVAFAAAPLSGSWSLSMKTQVQTFSIVAMESVLSVNYELVPWTFSSTAIADCEGLSNVYFDVGGPLGGLAIRSIMDFDAPRARFRTWLASAVTSIAGVNLYSTFMLDDTTPTQTASAGTGLTLGGWYRGDPVSVWFQSRFNMTDSSTNLYKYGYEWLLDHFIFRVCDSWQKPSGYLDVQTGGCSLAWSGFDVFLEMPFACFTVLTELGVSCSGFESLLFEVNDIDTGLTWLDLKWVDLFFTLDTKSVTMVFDLSIADSDCITPYMVLGGGGNRVTDISLKALKYAHTWDGITFKAGHLFDEDGWAEYLNHTFYEWGWTWDGELSYLAPCKVPRNYDEYFGVLIDGDACCGESYHASLFSWFDTGSETAGIFDWVETRVDIRTGLSANVAVTVGVSVTTSGIQWFKTGFDIVW